MRAIGLSEFVGRPLRPRRAPSPPGPARRNGRSKRLPHLAWVLLLLLAPLARADSHTEALDLIASMTAALSDDDAPAFLKEIDKSMPGYDRLEHAIPELLEQGAIACSVQPLTDEGDDAKRAVELDWYMEIRNVDETVPIVRRREVIHLRMEKRGKHWRVTSLDPISFFDPHDFTHK